MAFVFSPSIVVLSLVLLVAMTGSCCIAACFFVWSCCWWNDEAALLITFTFDLVILDFSLWWSGDNYQSKVETDKLLYLTMAHCECVFAITKIGAKFVYLCCS